MDGVSKRTETNYPNRTIFMPTLRKSWRSFRDAGYQWSLRKDGNAKPFAFSTMQHIVQRVRKATGEVDYVEALAH